MSTAVQLRDRQKAARFNSVRALLESAPVRRQVALALPKYMTPERMLRVAVTALKNNPRLLECTEGSLINSVTQAAELGLEVNSPLGYAYLVPYKDQCTLQIGYRGFINLAHRSGRVSSMAAEVVYENDTFSIELGTNRRLIHRPFLNGDRGKKLGAYATVNFRDGTTDFEYMAADEIAAIKARSAGARQKGGPWDTDENEMWRKTPIRRLAKRVPMTADDQSLLRAAVIDEYNDMGVPIPGQIAPAPSSLTDDKISEGQRMALVASAKASGADLPAIIAAAGFDIMANITVEAYDEIMAATAIKPAAEPEEPEAIQGEPVFNEDEVMLVDLREDVNQAITEKIGGMPGDRKRYLKGRDINQLSAEELSDMLHELQEIV